MESITTKEDREVRSSPQDVPTKRAAELNQGILAAIQSLLAENPAANILSVIPSTYAKKLRYAKRSTDFDTSDSEGTNRPPTTARKSDGPELMMSEVTLAPKPKKRKSRIVPQQPRENKIGDPSNPQVLKRKYGPGVKPYPLSRMKKLCDEMLGPVQNNITIISPLSDVVTNLLHNHEVATKALPEAVRDLLEHGELLYCGMYEFVVRCGADIVAKCRQTSLEDSLLVKEMRTLQYLEQHAPIVPAPRLHGMISVEDTHVIFMTYLPSMNLEQAWPTLNETHKFQVQDQLDSIMRELRQCRQAPGLPFGYVDGSGVAEIRFMDMREATEPITTEEELDNFIFPMYPQAGENYIEIFRRLLPKSDSGSVLTHGDFRPANIMVEVKNDQCRVTGIIDWEMAGFYPEYYEANRAANLLLPTWKSDWYLFFPRCISPAVTPVRWLFDRLWDYHIRHHMIYIRYLDADGNPCYPPDKQKQSKNSAIKSNPEKLDSERQLD